MEKSNESMDDLIFLRFSMEKSGKSMDDLILFFFRWLRRRGRRKISALPFLRKKECGQ